MRMFKQNDQRGMVAITVTVVIIALVTLITLGFATLVRRDQRQSLDRQLSTQAFYAAESGINDAVEWLKAGNTEEIETCKESDTVFTSNELSSDNAIQYSCMLVDRSPDELLFDPVGVDKSVVFPVKSSAGNNIDKISFSWQGQDDNNDFGNFANDNHNLQSGSNAPILRVDIIPTNSVDRSTLISSTRTFFLYPKEDSNVNQNNAIVYNSNKQAQQIFVDGKCNTGSKPQFCNVSISNLDSSGSGQFYVRLKAIYTPAIVTVRGYVGANQVELADSQAVIDVTGKAGDVLRRLQATVPLRTTYDYPEFAIETTDTICKRLAVWPGGSGGTLVGGASVDLLPANFDPNIKTGVNEAICNPTEL